MSDLDAFLEDDACSRGVVRKECSTALSPSRLPGLDLALNPYTRCGHDCTYCYAPYIMRVSPSEWGGKVQAKVNIPKVLAKELPRKKGVIGLGTVTDPYQPVERELRLTRRCLEEMVKVPTKVSVLTKSDLVVRDIDLLLRIEDAEVGITVNTTSDRAAAVFEACAPPPSRRLAALSALVASGVRTYVFLGPIIPSITDEDVGTLVNAIATTGVRRIMVDRLNLRPGMRARMEAVLEQRAPDLLLAFRYDVGSPDFYGNAISAVRARCREQGITCQDAF
ncbi:MAG: radical SAM protein [Methanomassiliicoccus sp.]|nr:radical SAM protein [Methanomassiliicoccus sp.]